MLPGLSSQAILFRGNASRRETEWMVGVQSESRVGLSVSNKITSVKIVVSVKY